MLVLVSKISCIKFLLFIVLSLNICKEPPVFSIYISLMTLLKVFYYMLFLNTCHLGFLAWLQLVKKLNHWLLYFLEKLCLCEIPETLWDS